MKQFADRRRSDRQFQEGDSVYLKLHPRHLKSLSPGPISKLQPKYYGPFLITAKIGSVAYKLQLPEDSNIHPVFHVSLLKKAVSDQQASPNLPNFIQGTEQPKEPRAILDKRVLYKHGAPIPQVLVSWSGLHADNNTWEYLPDLLNQFPRAASLLSIS